MANEILRMNYFDGLKLYKDEFIKEQNYHIRMRRLHNRRLHTWGIVWGLDVIKKDPNSLNEHILRITEGMALNLVKKNYINDDSTFKEEVSEEIVNIDNNYEIDLQTITPPLSIVYVYATYFESKSSGTGTVVDKYWKETAKIEVASSKPIDPPEENKYILLAKVTYDVAANRIINIDKTVPMTRAPSAGISTDSIETKDLKLSMASPAQGNLAAINGSMFTQGNGIKVDSPMTEFTGPLKIDQGGIDIIGPVNINGNITISGTVDGRKVSTDGTSSQTHIAIKNGNPHGTTVDHIDGTTQEIIKRINLINGTEKINKERINSKVGSTGWVRLPFLPKKYATNDEFIIYGTKAISATGAYGCMEIPIPINAEKISSFVIAGERNSGKIHVWLTRERWSNPGNIATQNTDYLLNNHEISSLSDKFYDKVDDTINPPSPFSVTPTLDNTSNLDLLVRAEGAAVINFIAINFD